MEKQKISIKLLNMPTTKPLWHLDKLKFYCSIWINCATQCFYWKMILKILGYLLPPGPWKHPELAIRDRPSPGDQLFSSRPHSKRENSRSLFCHFQPLFRGKSFPGSGSNPDHDLTQSWSHCGTVYPRPEKLKEKNTFNVNDLTWKTSFMPTLQSG